MTTSTTDARHQAFASHGRQRIAISGASGLIGAELVRFLRAGGHEVLRLVRRAPASNDEIRWDPRTPTIDSARLEGIDAVVNLAGEPVAERWTAAHKRDIRDSRVDGTALIANTIATLQRAPRVLVNASAIGFYGDRGDEALDERSGPGRGFLPDVARQWEAATEPARGRGTRVALARLGVVVSPRGGALGKLLPFFRVGAGGRIGNGRQWMSTIALDDVVGAIHHLLFTDAIAGPVNVTGPEPVTNGDFAHTLGRVLHRPSIATVPEFALRLAYGEMAEETLLASQRVYPRVLEESGFRFRHRTVEEQFRFELGRG
jgi:uncharacterized protein (TIGR01777 family)